MDDTRAVTRDDLACAHEDFASERVNAVAKNAVTSSGLRAAARVPEGVARNAMTFDVEVRQGDRCDQQRSGRCWMFASLNTFRYRIIRKYGLKTFELSQSYPLFWDKLEKSNWFLENVLDTLDEPLDGRLVSYLLRDPIGDGGQWDMFKSLVKKYGVVPKEAMPETACSRNTSEMDSYLTRFLRGAAKRLRQSHEAGVGAEDLADMKKEMLGDVYHLLATCLGEPPASFSVRLRDKDDQVVLSGTYTPCQFFDEAVGMELDDYVSLDLGPHRRQALRPRLHRLAPGQRGRGRRRALPQPAARRAQALRRRPAARRPARVVRLRRGPELPERRGHHGHRRPGRRRPARLPRRGLPRPRRAPRLRRVPHDPRHGPRGRQPRRRRPSHPVEGREQWGKDHGRDGFDTLSDPWFDEYVYQVVVDKKYLTPEELDTYEHEEATVLAPWDPMGSLARCN